MDGSWRRPRRGGGRGPQGTGEREYSPGDLVAWRIVFNRLTDWLERAEEQRRHLTADVAHELRTPLHIIQGNLEGVL